MLAAKSRFPISALLLALAFLSACGGATEPEPAGDADETTVGGAPPEPPDGGSPSGDGSDDEGESDSRPVSKRPER